MIQRLLNIIKSLRTGKRIHETEVSTTVDDIREGKRITFKEESVREILEKCELLEREES